MWRLTRLNILKQRLILKTSLAPNQIKLKSDWRCWINFMLSSRTQVVQQVAEADKGAASVSSLVGTQTNASRLMTGSSRYTTLHYTSSVTALLISTPHWFICRRILEHPGARSPPPCLGLNRILALNAVFFCCQFSSIKTTTWCLQTY